ncbi:hypothetical protein VTI74DRAFT_1113 [Chaetomium olivicolor]
MALGCTPRLLCPLGDSLFFFGWRTSEIGSEPRRSLRLPLALQCLHSFSAFTTVDGLSFTLENFGDHCFAGVLRTRLGVAARYPATITSHPPFDSVTALLSLASFNLVWSFFSLSWTDGTLGPAEDFACCSSVGFSANSLVSGSVKYWQTVFSWSFGLQSFGFGLEVWSWDWVFELGLSASSFGHGGGQTSGCCRQAGQGKAGQGKAGQDGHCGCSLGSITVVLQLLATCRVLNHAGIGPPRMSVLMAR